MLPVSQDYFFRVDQQCPGRIKVKSLDIIISHIVIEAVVLARVNGIKLINLYEMEASQRRFLLQEQSVVLSDLTGFGTVPVIQQVFCPFDEILRCLARRQADDSVGVAGHPFKEPE